MINMAMNYNILGKKLQTKKLSEAVAGLIKEPVPGNNRFSMKLVNAILFLSTNNTGEAHKSLSGVPEDSFEKDIL